MRLKSVIYKEEQENVITQLYNILNPIDNVFILYELEHDNIKVKQIMDLFPNIKKYFTLSNLPALAYPENSKRSYLSVLKILLKKKYRIISSDCRIKINGKTIRSIKYKLENLIPDI
jgi:hypothetical protein